ncbi:MAG: DUF1836 domain-containing protein [Lachnospiraceae bacterium]|nr:DUF1836 domain-containing protein [Lachnospiraceae bacterium]
MNYNKDLIAGKLRRWEKYLENYRLPRWEDIPDMGLYMEQVIKLLTQYLDYFPPELKEDNFITAATINNYVRKKIMPEPVNRKYYRKHIAYLIIICSLKQSLSIPVLQKMIPVDLTEEELKETYTAYVNRQKIGVSYFAKQVRLAAAGVLDHEYESELATDSTEDLIYLSAVISGFARLFAEKLLLLEGKTLENGGDIKIKQ